MSIDPADLNQTMTLWPRTGSGYGPAEVRQVFWGPERRQKIPGETQRQAAVRASVITSGAAAIGDCVAYGDHGATTPGLVPTVHEVVEYRRTQGFEAADVVHRLTAAPLLGQLRQTLRVFPVLRVPTARSYALARGGEIYNGPGSITMLDQVATLDAGAKTLTYNTTITLPYTSGVGAATRYEVEWADSPYGLMVFDARGIIVDPMQSPFWRTLAATGRLPETNLEQAP